MTDQQYNYDGRPGCVMRHKSRATKTTIGIYKADQAGLDGSSGAWIAICETHGEMYGFPTLRHAQKNYSGAPWCTQCHPTGVSVIPSPPPLKSRRPKSSPYVGISADGHIRINYQLYEQMGSPTHFHVQWITGVNHLLIAPASVQGEPVDNTYPVRQAQRVNGTRYGTGRVTALAPVRQSGLAPGRYKPKVQGDQVILKARFKIDDEGDEPADDAAADPTAEAQH